MSRNISQRLEKIEKSSSGYVVMPFYDDAHADRLLEAHKAKHPRDRRQVLLIHDPIMEKPDDYDEQKS